MSPASTSFVQVDELCRTQVIPTKSETATLDSGGSLTVLCQLYSDKIFVSVSQRDKLGYLVQAQVQSNLLSVDEADHSIPPLPNVSLVPLFGVPPYPMQDLYPFYATQIALRVSETLHPSNNNSSFMAEQTPKPIVVGLALDPLSQDEEGLATMQERQRIDKILDLLLSCRVW